MKSGVFTIEAVAEESHWWFVGRRRLFAQEISAIRLAPDARVLDLGTSTGANLRMLQDLGYANVTGLDASEEAIHWCRSKNLGDVVKGDITRLPFASDNADLIMATDVLEHVDNDALALSEIARVLKPGATALITVPAFKILWGLQDEVAQHKRRYRIARLRRLVAGAGLEISKSFYFNYILFFPILAARQVLKVMRPGIRSENEINSAGLNRLLGAIFAMDLATAPLLRPPFGVSAFLMASKPKE